MVLFFSNCTKVIDIKLNDADKKLVIEGMITDTAGAQTVRVSETVSFSSSNIFNGVSGAFLSITDVGFGTDTLQEVAPGVYKTSTIQGVPGHTYQLRVVRNGNTYTASSTMPARVNLDSLGISVFEFGGQTNISVVPYYNDPSTPGNNYFMKQYVNGKFDEGITIYNDEVSNGVVNQRPIFSNVEIKPGDKVDVELFCVDQVTHDYFFTLSEISGNGPGGGTTPTNPPNNIDGDALGYFSANSYDRKSIIIP